MADQDIKFTEDELKSLQDLQTEYQQKQLQFGQLKVQKLLVQQQVDAIENQVYILNLLKEKHNFFKLDWDEFGLDFPLSVDGLHFDETYHEKIAKEFYKKKVN